MSWSMCSVQLAQGLLENDLVDELPLMVFLVHALQRDGLAAS